MVRFSLDPSQSRRQPVGRNSLTSYATGFGKIRENGISGVGCNQFFSSYAARGGDSIIWKVYANRVCGLVLRSDLCSTDPWIRTRSPQWEISLERTRFSLARCMLTWFTSLEDVLAFLSRC